jgi:hypothetical protein
MRFWRGARLYGCHRSYAFALYQGPTLEAAEKVT